MYSDSENYDWAGNLVVHQLKQDENGELHPVPIDNVIEKIKKDTKIKLIEYTKTINKNKYMKKRYDKSKPFEKKHKSQIKLINKFRELLNFAKNL